MNNPFHTMSTMTTMSKLLACLGLALLCLTAAAKTNRLYLIGNSLTDQVKYNAFKDLAASRGHYQPWGRQMIPGAPIEWLWQHPGEGFQEPPYGYPTNALPYYDWDCLTLQPFSRPLSSDTNFITLFTNLGLPRNTNMQVYVYAQWPTTDKLV